MTTQTNAHTGDAAQIGSGAQAPRTGTTAYGTLERLTAERPEATLFLEPMGEKLTEVSRQEFLSLVRRYANRLVEAGIGAGDCIAVWLPNWSSTYAWQFAASAVGAHVIGVNTRYNYLEVGHVLHKARPKLLVMAHAFQRINFLATLEKSVAEVKNFSPPLVIAAMAPGTYEEFDLAPYDLGGGAQTDQTDAPDASAAFRREGDLSLLTVAFTTSGSTGMPKLAAHDEYGVTFHAERVAKEVPFGPDDVLVAALPFSGVFGYVASMGAIYGGSAILLHPVFNADRLLRQWHEAGATHFIGADDMISRVRQAWERNNLDLSSWKFIGIADFQGQSRELAQWAKEQFGTITGGVYGSSEVFALMSFWRADSTHEEKLSGGGQMTSPEYKYRIMDPATEKLVPHGEQGEIQLLGPNVVNEYLGDEGEGAKNFAADGWFRTGDLGYAVNEDTYVYVCRIGDVLRLKGFLVDPAEIENRLIQHPAVEVGKVVGAKDDAGEPIAVAFVNLVPGTSATGEELREWCKEALARFKVPSEVRIIDEMPTTAGTNGAKIKAATLREWAKQPQAG